MPKANEKPLGEIFIEYRAKHGINRAKLGALLGIGEKMVTEYEAGRYNGTAVRRKKFIAILSSPKPNQEDILLSIFEELKKLNENFSKLK